MSNAIRCPACHSENVECEPKPHMHVCSDCGYDGTTTGPDHLTTEAAELELELERIRAELNHHLDPLSDPCQDRGVDWPCDVAMALRPELDDEVTP